MVQWSHQFAQPLASPIARSESYTRIYHTMAINITRWSICLLVLLSILPSVFGLYFYLEGSEQKCFTEELPKETMVSGTMCECDPDDLTRMFS